MKINQATIFFSVIIVLVFGAIITFMLSGSSSSKVNYDAFATCLKDKGATFYGAFWCPHCITTKKFFGSSGSLLPYVECSTPDGQGQLPVCTDKKITGYPTWILADGTEITGEISSAKLDNLFKLSEKTACPLPVGAPQKP